MPDKAFSNYFYGDEAMQYNYFRIPCQLITHPRFKHLSTDSKLLYGMLLDRMSLSIKNEWYVDTGRVYIYYTVEEICDSLTCGRDKAMKLLAELDTGKGIGLIERIKQGQGKPDRIYVMRFTTQELPPQPEKEPEPPVLPQFDDAQTLDFPNPRGRNFRRAEVEETDPNHINILIRNQIDLNHPDPSTYPPTPSARQMEIDRCELREEGKESIEYEHLRQELPLRIEDFVFPYGKLDPENDWVKLAALVPWDVAEERYAVRFVNNGHPAHPARMAQGALLIQRRLKCSDEWLVKHIGENPYLQYFIGMKKYGPCPFGASMLVVFRKRFSEEDMAVVLEASVPKEERPMPTRNSVPNCTSAW